MLYQMYEALHASWAPWRVSGSATTAFRNGNGSPSAEKKSTDALGSMYDRSIVAAREIFDRGTRRWGKPAFGLDATNIGGMTVPVREQVLLERAFCSLIHFERDAARTDPRVLIVPPLSGHYATLVRGTVEAMLPEHDIYVADWKNARDVPLSEGPFDLDDYIDYVLEFIRALGPDVHLMAVCQPVVPVLAAVALLASAGQACPRSMTLMGGPVDTRRSPTVVNWFATSHDIRWFEDRLIATVPAHYPGAMRRVYPGFVQLTAFMSMNPDRHVNAHIKLFEDLVRGDEAGVDAHRRFYDEYLSVMDLPAEFYLQTVRSVFQEHELARGVFVSRGRPVEPAAITDTALLTIEGERDDISGLGQTEAAHDLCVSLAPAQREHYVQPDAGHFGIFSGRRWRNEVMPRVRAFIREHDRKTRRGTGGARRVPRRIA